MPFTIVVISDLHYSSEDLRTQRRGQIAHILLERAVHRINRMLKPDVTLFMGDLVNDGDAPGADALWKRLRAIAGRLECPVIVLPGNHDGSPERFRQAFPDPGEVVDIGPVRFLVFHDAEEPGWNARRSPRDLARMAAAAGHDGPVVMLQHCALYPPGASDCPYKYVNAAEILERMRRYGISLAVSGHFHRGVDLIQHESGSFVIAPGMCEAPFSFLEITLDGQRVQVRRHPLRMPDSLRLVDCHVHTPFAYCSEDMDFAQAVSLAQDFGLAGLAFTEHSGQLYYDADTYWRGRFLDAGAEGDLSAAPARMAQYLEAARAHCPPAILGLEVDCDYAGRPVLRAEDRARVPFLIGAVHALPALSAPAASPDCLHDQYLGLLQQFLRSGVRVYSHPFRVFRRAGREAPESLFRPVAHLLREHGVAAELNFHTNEPSVAFAAQCLESGVKLALGSDAHALWEIGEFAPHLHLLEQCGYDGEPRDVLLDPGS